MPGATLLLVHGAWHGSWVWDDVRERLGDLPVETVDLPTTQVDGGDLTADVAELKNAVGRIDGPVVVVAHSYGGLVATQALADRANVVRLVFVAAFMLDVGESLGEVVPGQSGAAPDWWSIQGNRVTALRPSEIFYDDVSPAVAQAAISRLTTQEFSSQVARPSVAAWRSVPSTYVVCTQDRAVPLDLQLVMSGRAQRVEQLDSSHSPMLSQPDNLASILRAEVDRV